LSGILEKSTKLILKKYSYIIIDDDAQSILRTKSIADAFAELTFTASGANSQEGLNLVLQHRPSLVFLEIDPKDTDANLSLAFINELYRFLAIIPKIIITTTKKTFAFDAIQYNVFDYLLKPVTYIDLLKTVLKLEKAVSELTAADTKNEIPALVSDIRMPHTAADPLTICIKSYGDYRYIQAADIAYLQADNNSTDIYLNSGETITAFKTLKHFEGVLAYPFIRIHNSYIINRNYISRIHNGNSVCYVKNSSKKVPFSKTYKANVDLIISDFAAGNYIEV